MFSHYYSLNFHLLVCHFVCKWWIDFLKFFYLRWTSLAWPINMPTILTVWVDATLQRVAISPHTIHKTKTGRRGRKRDDGPRDIHTTCLSTVSDIAFALANFQSKRPKESKLSLYMNNDKPIIIFKTMATFPSDVLINFNEKRSGLTTITL